MSCATRRGLMDAVDLSYRSMVSSYRDEDDSCGSTDDVCLRSALSMARFPVSFNWRGNC